MRKIVLFCFLVQILTYKIYAQNSTISPQGIILPQMSTSQIDALLGQSKGTMVFDNLLNVMKYWDGTTWQNIANTYGTWQIDGNNQYSTNTGNVGIGIATPNYKLSVEGDLGLFDVGSNYGSLNKNTTSGALIINASTSPTMLFAPKNLGIQVGGNNGIYNYYAGNVGVGTATPLTKLDVVGELMTRKRLTLSNQAGSDPAITPVWSLDNYNNDFRIFQQPTLTTSGNTHFVVKNNTGEVAIGTFTTDGYKLSVNGSIRAKEVVIESNWADYVFEDSFKLRPLSEVKTFIAQNKHLPDIPSAKEIQENGGQVSLLMTKMMQKIEELTLYIIEQQKEIDTLKQK
ncbi:hypothetical protein EMA8858_04031 [Emticicia aquatica]|jgi:hypothetical protein|uniref:Peptidase S74 domain-containing protein n=1 Tax=Emticicia aquatica TaxID=1681835 RepID=A0ABN8F365_9BACT|nr:hypothetical protein [Emticicia aquatica]CAH0997896.1 hypothetical protein EMA8858_04031 [Emticicia aquatica]